MDLLEQPMEAVAFRIHSLPEVAAAASAAWTCLAAVLAAAAAAGLWRLRSSTHADFTVPTKRPLELDTSPSLMTSTETQRSAPERPAAPTASTPAPSPKERYTAYYKDDSGRVGCCFVESDGDEEGRDPEDDDDDGVYGAWATDPFKWEVVRPLMATATAHGMGRRRSPRALSGSVVQLWDQGAEWGLTAASFRLRAGTISSF